MSSLSNQLRNPRKCKQKLWSHISYKLSAVERREILSISSYVCMWYSLSLAPFQMKILYDQNMLHNQQSLHGQFSSLHFLNRHNNHMVLNFNKVWYFRNCYCHCINVPIVNSNCYISLFNRSFIQCFHWYCVNFLTGFVYIRCKYGNLESGLVHLGVALGVGFSSVHSMGRRDATALQCFLWLFGPKCSDRNWLTLGERCPVENSS